MRLLNIIAQKIFNFFFSIFRKMPKRKYNKLKEKKECFNFHFHQNRDMLDFETCFLCPVHILPDPVLIRLLNEFNNVYLDYNISLSDDLDQIDFARFINLAVELDFYGEKWGIDYDLTKFRLNPLNDIYNNVKLIDGQYYFINKKIYKFFIPEGLYDRLEIRIQFNF